MSVSPDFNDEMCRRIYDLVDDPEYWMSTPNEKLGGRTPIDLLTGTDDERDLLNDYLGTLNVGELM